MVKKLVFRIRKKYLDDIEAGKKTVEYRRYTPFWIVRITGSTVGIPVGATWKTDPGEFEAVFICGKRIHRREITAIARIPTPFWFSDQGKKDVDTETCFALFLGNISVNQEMDP